MKSTSETIDLLQCSPSSIRLFIKDGRLDVAISNSNDRRKKFFTDASVEKLMISRESISSKNSSKKIEKKTVEKFQKKIEKKTGRFKLNEVGKSIMAETIDEMKMLGIYRKNDNYAIFDYAMFYQISMATMEIAAQNVIDGMYERINHDIKISLMINKLLDAKRKSLGLDPAAREKLTIKEQKSLDEMGDLING